MLKNLKKKFIFTNMLLVGMVLLIVFIFICSNAYKLQMEEIEKTLRAPIGKDIKNEKGEFGFMTSIIVIIDRENEVSEVITRGATLDQRSLENITNKVMSEDRYKGKINEYNLFYERNRLESGFEIITFVDSLRMKKVMQKTIALSLISFVFSMIGVFFISKFIANIAIEPVRKSWKQQKQFVEDASHELKTPITVILANNNILKSRKNFTIGEEMQWIDSTEEEANHMKKLIDDMLFLAKNDTLDIKEEMCNISLSDLVEADFLQFEPVAYERGIKFTSNIDEGIDMIAERKQMKQLIHILLDNGIKYAKTDKGEKEGHVHIELIKEHGAILTVRNTGSIIPMKDKEHIFDRFYRCDDSRTRLNYDEDIYGFGDRLRSGYGLGLAIAKTIVENHNGTVEVRSDEKSGPMNKQGTAFEIKF